MIYKLMDHIHYEGDEETPIIVDITNGKFFELNAISHNIIKLINQGSEVESIAEHISLKYSVDYKRVLNDVEKFIAQLVEMKILESI